MADEATNLIMEQLQLLRRGQEEMRAGIGELNKRMTGFETNQAHMLAQMGHLQLQIASQTSRTDRMEVRFDRIDDRLERIERRLDRIEHHLGLVQA